MEFPNQRRFAFTILDDTDDSTLENVRPVYERLHHYGLLATKTVWPLACPEGSRIFFAADTLERPDYLAFVRELLASGFEIGFHGATMETSERERTLRGLEFLKREFGSFPRLHANHGDNRENLYWGAERFRTPWLRALVRLTSGRLGWFCGEDPKQIYFWGDVCRERIDYVRNFTFPGLNLLAFDPDTPYEAPSTPHVRSWFSTTDAPDGDAFLERITPSAIDRLEAEGGACIVSTHLGKRFVRDGMLRPEIDERLRYLSEKPGWFVPVSPLLDHLRARKASQPIGRLRLLRLELRYLAQRAGEWIDAKIR